MIVSLLCLRNILSHQYLVRAPTVSEDYLLCYMLNESKERLSNLSLRIALAEIPKRHLRGAV